jgi:hypothetical protein
MLELSGCAGRDHREVSPGIFDVTGYLLDAKDSAVEREASRVYPSGYIVESKLHSSVAEGPTLTSRVQCNQPKTSD